MSKKQSGFSLVELMVVLSIMAVIAAVCIPAVVNALPAYRLEHAARQLSGQLRKARSTAIRENRKVEVRFFAGQRTYRIDGRTMTLAEGITFGYGHARRPAGAGRVLPSDGITFRSNRITFNARGIGTCSGYAYLQNERGRTIAIGATTAGNISFRYWDGAWK